MTDFDKLKSVLKELNIPFTVHSVPSDFGPIMRPTIILEKRCFISFDDDERKFGKIFIGEQPLLDSLWY